MSVVHHAFLVMCRKQFALNVFSKTTKPKTLIFLMKHCLKDLLQVCSIGDPRAQNGPAAGSFVFENELCFKLPLPTASLRYRLHMYFRVCKTDHNKPVVILLTETKKDKKRKDRN